MVGATGFEPATSTPPAYNAESNPDIEKIYTMVPYNVGMASGVMALKFKDMNSNFFSYGGVNLGSIYGPKGTIRWENCSISPISYNDPKYPEFLLTDKITGKTIKFHASPYRTNSTTSLRELHKLIAKVGNMNIHESSSISETKVIVTPTKGNAEESVESKLESLSAMRDSGLITQEEYKEKKQDVLSKSFGQ